MKNKQHYQNTIALSATISFCLLIFLFVPALAAPMPSQVAINEKTNKCGFFWGGDERVQYNLKEGWQAYFPKFKFEITTDFGKCTIPENSEASECCKQLGLKYINYKDIPYNKKKVGEFICDLPFHIDGVQFYEGISINKNTKECTELLSYHLKKEDDTLGNYDQDYKKDCLIDKNWTDYEKTNIIAKVYETPKGTCEIASVSSSERDYYAKQCCKQLGLKYSSDTANGPGSVSQIKKILAVFAILLLLIILVIVIVRYRKK